MGLRRVRWYVIAPWLGTFGCGGHEVTTLDDLAQRRDVRVELNVERDVCRCPCAETVCWSFRCDSSCSVADEYVLTVKHGPESGSADCLPGTDSLRATLTTESGDELAPFTLTDTCGTLTATWRELPEHVDLRASHQVELTDSSGAWTVLNPFREFSVTVVGPSQLVAPAAGDTPALDRGDTVTVDFLGSAHVVSATATLTPTRAFGETSRLAVEISGARLELPIPLTAPPGASDLALSVRTELLEEACSGPPRCQGRDVSARWEVTIE